MIIKVKCPKGDLNEIDVQELIRKNTVPIPKAAFAMQTDRLPETLVTNCHVCGERIVILKSQIQNYLEK